MKELREFLMEANQHGYASGNPGVKEEDGSTTITYPPEGDIEGWKFRDHFYGGEPYGGQEVVFRNEKPYWTMVYYGTVYEEEDLANVYPFLQKALLQGDEKFPVRGPASFMEGDLHYKNNISGDLDSFSGTEAIVRQGDGVYEAFFAGGLVDQRREL